jgi:hypothetical protein
MLVILATTQSWVGWERGEHIELWPFFFFLFGEQMQTIAMEKKSQTPFVMFRPRMQELLNIEQHCH